MMIAIPIDLIRLVFPTAFVPYNRIPLVSVADRSFAKVAMLSVATLNERSFDTYNSFSFNCSIKQ